MVAAAQMQRLTSTIILCFDSSNATQVSLKKDSENTLSFLFLSLPMY